MSRSLRSEVERIMALPKAERSDAWSALPWSQREIEIMRSTVLAEQPGFNSALADRAQRRMERMDALPADVRAIVHEYGLEIVHIFLEQGVKSAKKIKFLIDAARSTDNPDGTRRFALNRGPNSRRNILDVLAQEDEDETTYKVRP